MIKGFINLYKSKIFHIIIINANNIFFKFIIKTILSIHNTENVFVKKIRNKLTSVTIKNFYYWRQLHQPKNSVETEFIRYIREKISEPHIILDLGSRDAIQSIDFSLIFPNAKIFAFECNPACLKKCLANTVNLKNIEIIPKAVYNKDTKVNFYSTITNKTGTSSLFKSNTKYESIFKIHQKKIEVEATRIDTWARERGLKKIDLCWVDLQGAEYEALDGLGDLIYDVQAMYVEVELQEIYEGQKLFNDVKDFLKKKGFTIIQFNTFKSKWWGNVVFLNDKLLNKKLKS